MLLLGGCSTPCIDMCQQYALYLDRCGYGWSTIFQDEGWTSIDDCYDDWWEAEEAEYGYCSTEIRHYSERSCY